MKNIYSVVVVVLVVIFVLCFIKKSQKENLSGYGVTSALAFNNRLAYCQPGDPSIGWSGGCFLPHKVIL